jgi:PPM family protein phosphatase
VNDGSDEGRGAPLSSASADADAVDAPSERVVAVPNAVPPAVTGEALEATAGEGDMPPQEEPAASPVPTAVSTDSEDASDGATDDVASAPTVGGLEELLLPPVASVEPLLRSVGDRVRMGDLDLEIGRALPAGWNEAMRGDDLFVFREGATYWTWNRSHPLLPEVAYVGRDGVVLRAAEGDPLVPPLTIADAVRLAVALARLVRFFEAQGLSVLDIDPDALVHGARGVRLKVPPRITPVGAPSPITFREGFTAPEARTQAVATGREGVYVVGALIHYLITGRPIPPDGLGPVLLGTFAMPGLPQVLARALAEDASERMTLNQLAVGLRELERSIDPGVQRSMNPTLDVAIATTIGLNPDRHINEDGAGYARLMLAEGSTPRSVLVACVSDGMGGAEAGEVASKAAVRAFCHLEPGAGVQGLGEQAAWTERLAWEANAAVLAALAGRDGGCTLTGVVMVGDRLTVAHVGDSRAYLRSATGLEQLTRDHSLVAALVASGTMSAQEAESSQDRSTILRSLGSVRQPQGSYVDNLAVQRGDISLQLEPGDALLLCSDGVWGEVADAVFDEVLTAASSANEAATQLVGAALEAGAPDNATVLVVRMV